LVVIAEQKKGHWLNQNFPHGAKSGEGFGRSHKFDSGELMPASPDESANARLIAEENDLIIRVIEEIEKSIRQYENTARSLSFFSIKKHTYEKKIPEKLQIPVCGRIATQ